jgi:hypothetical protein
LYVNQLHNLGKKVLLFIRSLSRGEQHGGVGADFVLHPLIHTRLEFNLAQDVDYGQRFPGLGSESPQTGHTFAVSLIIKLALHLGHLTGWSLTRLISSAIGGLFMRGRFLFRADTVVERWRYGSWVISTVLTHSVFLPGDLLYREPQKTRFLYLLADCQSLLGF